jgi:RNA polymerase sigma-70 factor (TIGR02960 family)
VPIHRHECVIQITGDESGARRRSKLVMTTSHDELLPAARAGDESAYRTLVDPLRPELQAHCYRMLGSVHDAEDAMQDTLLRAWRGLAGFEGRSSFRSWLYTIATNACLAMIERRPSRMLPTGLDPSVPMTERVSWLEPYPAAALPEGPPDARYEQRESVELAFVAALQFLPAKQRAVLVLRDVLGFSAREVAEALGTTVAAVNSALQRAHASVDERLPDRSQQATLRALGDEELKALVDRYVAAWEAADVPAIVAMLADDARFSMPPYAEFYTGLDEITEAIKAGPMTLRWRFVAIRANEQVAFGTYCLKHGTYTAGAIDVITLRGNEIVDITAFLGADQFQRFGLPLRLDA